MVLPFSVSISEAPGNPRVRWVYPIPPSGGLSRAGGLGHARQGRAGRSCRRQVAPSGPVPWGPPRGNLRYYVPYGWSGLFPASGRSAPGARLPGGGPHFSREMGRKRAGGKPPGPRFYSRSFPLADFCSSCLCNGRGAISSGMLRPIWDAFSRKNMLKSIFAKESSQIRVRTWVTK